MAGAGALAWRPRPVTLLAALLAGAMLTITSAAPAAPADSHKALELKAQLQHQASRTNHWKRVANCDLGAGANASANELCQHSQAETFSPLVLAAMAASNAERLAEAVAVETKEAARWRKVAGDVSCKSAKVGPTGGFCANTHGTNECLNKGFADFIANDILFASTNSSTASVIDLGCGQGQYGAYWRSGEAKAKFGAGKALRWQGIDGTEDIAEASKGLVKFFDLTDPVFMGMYDWAISIEVAEHLPPFLEPAIWYNLDRHNTHGIILTWAKLGQPGSHHVNCQSQQYVTCVAEKVLGYEFAKAETEGLRRAVHGGVCPWLGYSSMVFKRDPERKGAFDLRPLEDIPLDDQAANAAFRASFFDAGRNAGCARVLYPPGWVTHAGKGFGRVAPGWDPKTGKFDTPEHATEWHKKQGKQ